MELKIYWTDFSKKELQNIFDYHKKNAILKVAKRLTIGIAGETLKLKINQKLVKLRNYLLTDQMNSDI